MKRIFVIFGGILSILLGAFHLSFWKMFDWATELPKLSTANSNIMQMSTICIAVLLFAFGLILLIYSRQVLENKIGRLLLLVLSLFYFTRLTLGLIYPHSGITMSVILVVCVLVYLIPALPSKQDNVIKEKK